MSSLLETIEELERGREELHKKFGPVFREGDDKCHCAYCEKDFEAVADHAAELECELFLPGRWKDRAEKAESRATRAEAEVERLRCEIAALKGMSNART